MSTQFEKVITVQGVDFVIDNESYHIENPPQWLLENEDLILANVERVVELADAPISKMVMTIGLIMFGLISGWGSNREFWNANLKMDEDTFLTNMRNTYNNAFQTIMGAGEDEEKDDEEERTEPLVMEKVDWVTHTYTVGNGFMVDIVECPDEQWDGKWACYLYHNSYGTKMYMFGLPKGAQTPNLASVERIVLANLCGEDYIEHYSKEYMFDNI